MGILANASNEDYEAVERDRLDGREISDGVYVLTPTDRPYNLRLGGTGSRIFKTSLQSMSRVLASRAINLPACQPIDPSISHHNNDVDKSPSQPGELISSGRPSGVRTQMDRHEIVGSVVILFRTVARRTLL